MNSKASGARKNAKCYKRTGTGKNKSGGKKKIKKGVVCNLSTNQYVNNKDIKCYPRSGAGKNKNDKKPAITGGAVCNATSSKAFKKAVKKKAPPKKVVKKAPQKKKPAPKKVIKKKVETKKKKYKPAPKPKPKPKKKEAPKPKPAPKPKKKEEPKPKPKPKPAPKPAPKPVKKQEIIKKDNNLKVLGEFIEDFEKLLRHKSRRGYRAIIKKYPQKSHKFIENILEAQRWFDLYPTPKQCMKDLKADNWLRMSEHILEPSVGLGSMVLYLRNIGYKGKITGVELSQDMAQLVQQFTGNKTNIIQGDFLKQNFSNNNFDVVFMNPPYTGGDRMKNKLYYDFLLKSMEILHESKARGEKHIYMISPPITVENKNFIEPSRIYDRLGSAALGRYFKKYHRGKYHPKDILKTYKKYQNGEEFSEKKEKDLEFAEMFDDIYIPRQVERVGTCSKFAGTNLTAEMFQIIA